MVFKEGRRVEGGRNWWHDPLDDEVTPRLSRRGPQKTEETKKINTAIYWPKRDEDRSVEFCFFKRGFSFCVHVFATVLCVSLRPVGGIQAQWRGRRATYQRGQDETLLETCGGNFTQ